MDFVAKCSHHRTPVTRQFKKKLHHHRKQKMARISAGFNSIAPSHLFLFLNLSGAMEDSLRLLGKLWNHL